MSTRSEAIAGGAHGRQILVVESDRPVGLAIVEQLAADGYRAALACTAEHARVQAGASAPLLAVLGALDSRRGALELLEEIREPARAGITWPKETPVIVIGSGAELDLLRAFDAGADDYLARPARYLELRARLRALLRRTAGAAADERVLRVGALAIDLVARTVSLSGRAVDLRRQEFQLLMHLAHEPERVFSKEELLRAVWGYRASGSTRTLDSHASRLRRKLDVDGSPRWVTNVWGVGYRLT